VVRADINEKTMATTVEDPAQDQIFSLLRV
jgi:hypothetical protein